VVNEDRFSRLNIKPDGEADRKELVDEEQMHAIDHWRGK